MLAHRVPRVNSTASAWIPDRRNQSGWHSAILVKPFPDLFHGGHHVFYTTFAGRRGRARRRGGWSGSPSAWEEGRAKWSARAEGLMKRLGRCAPPNGGTWAVSRIDPVLAALLALGAGVWLWFALNTHIALEDAYITFRYAWNLAEGSGFAFNPGERVLGTTTPLQTLLLAALGRAVGPERIPLLAEIVMPLFGLLAGATMYLTLRRLGLARVGIALGLLLFLLHPLVIRTALGGMETPLALFLMALSMYFLARRRLSAATFSVALLALCRLDGLVWGALVLAAALWEVWGGRREQGAGARPARAGASGPVSGWEGRSRWCGALAYLHVPLLRESGAEHGEGKGRRAAGARASLVPGVARPPDSHSGISPAPAWRARSGCSGCGSACWGWACMRRPAEGRTPRSRRRHPSRRGAEEARRAHPRGEAAAWRPSAPGAACTPAGAVSAGLRGGHVRGPGAHVSMVSPADALQLPLPGRGRDRASDHLDAAAGPRSSARARWWEPRRCWFPGWRMRWGSSGRRCSTRRLFQENEWGLRRGAGLWLRAHTPEQATVAMEAIGYQGYFSRRRVVDMAGLVTPRVVEFKRSTGSNGEVFRRITTELAPDYILLRSFEVDTNHHFNGGKLFPTEADRVDFSRHYREVRRFVAPHPEVDLLVSRLTLYARTAAGRQESLMKAVGLSRRGLTLIASRGMMQ